MWKNYLLLAYRNLTRNRAFSLINIFGLAIGLTTCLLIMVYVLDETSYDRQFKNLDRLYRVALGMPSEGWAAGPAPLAEAMRAELPEVEESARLMKLPEMNSVVLEDRKSKSDKRFLESEGYYVDSTFFRVFSYDFIEGNPTSCLNQPNSMVISESIAQKLFGNDNAIGHTIQLGLPFGQFSYTVRGVFRDNNWRSHIPAHYFLSMRNEDVGGWVAGDNRWTMNNVFHTYVRLRPGTDQEAFSKKLQIFFHRHGGTEFNGATMSKTLLLQPVKDIYLHSALGDELGANGNFRSLYILSSIAIFILVIACINFMNLSTARSERRAREVGIRKVMGARRWSLIRQFLGESFLLCSIALVLALVLTWMLLPAFNNLTQKELQPFGEPKLIGVIVALTVFAGLLSGCYPAFYLSSFNPVSVLKGKLIHRLSAALLRKGLVVFQFTISIGLIVGAIVIVRQMDLFRNQDLGFDKDRQVILPMEGKELGMHYESLRNELLKSPYIQSVSSASTYPGIPNINDMPFYAEGKAGKDFVDVQMVTQNDHYFETLGLTLNSGRLLDPNEAVDTGSIILNTTAIRKFGYDPKTAVGKSISFQWQGISHRMRIIGITRDYNFESLENNIRPLGFSTIDFFGNKYAYLIAKIKTPHIASAVKYMGDTWNRINTSTPFSYSFLDQDFARNYDKENRTSSLVLYFTGVAILIACLGLFGLTAFAAEQRRKEIGIRKVLGATVANVTVLLSRDFMRLVAISIIIACPLAAFVMERWLRHFAYRTHLSWWIFAAAAVSAIVTAMVTISFQSVKAALANPVLSLRSE